jgi:hypothetical protein
MTCAPPEFYRAACLAFFEDNVVNVTNGHKIHQPEFVTLATSHLSIQQPEPGKPIQMIIAYIMA